MNEPETSQIASSPFLLAELVARNNMGVDLLKVGEAAKAFASFQSAHELLEKNRRLLSAEAYAFAYEDSLKCDDDGSSMDCSSFSSSESTCSFSLSSDDTDDEFLSAGQTNLPSPERNQYSQHKESDEEEALEWVDCSAHYTVERLAQNPHLTAADVAASVPFLCLCGVKCHGTRKTNISKNIEWIILFNLGITNSFLATQVGAYGRFFLQEAHQCYTNCQHHIPPSNSPNNIARVLLASQNNQVQIYHEFGMHQEYRSCLILLTQLVLATNPLRAPESIFGSIFCRKEERAPGGSGIEGAGGSETFASAVDLSGFVVRDILLNIMLYSAKQTASAA